MKKRSQSTSLTINGVLLILSLVAGSPVAAQLRIESTGPTDVATVRVVEDDRNLSVEALQERLGPVFREHSTSHFTLLSDAPREDVIHHAALLEQVHHQFTRVCNRLHLHIDQPAQRLACILFEKQADFREYASRYDDLTAGWIGGYYAGEGNYAVFHLARDDGNVAKLRGQLDEYDRKLDPLRDAVKRARADRDAERARELSAQLARHESQLERERTRIDAFSEAAIKARTVHETVHLLAFNLGVQSRFRPAPFWLSEGLATNFETDRPDRAFGPDFDDLRQRELFQKLLTEGRLVAFDRFLSLTDARSVTDDEAEAAYAQAYAFVHWAFRFRRAELGKCIQMYRGELTSEELARWSADPAAEHRRIFMSAFGSIDDVERNWIRWERSQCDN